MGQKEKNIFTLFLDLQKIKHTKSYSIRFFNEHPNKNSLWAISELLKYYNIENICIAIEKNDIDIVSEEAPFITYYESEFIIIKKIGETEIHYIRDGKDSFIKKSKFLESWAGIVLLTETNNMSGEPHFKENRRKELYTNISNFTLKFLAFLFILFFCILNNIYDKLNVILLLCVNFLGIYIGYLLILKQLKIFSKQADAICYISQKINCDNILNSNASKLWGIISWSEVGLSYFVSNSLLLLIAPNFIPYLAIINICVLPYSIWSIWYQKIKAKAWCPLCLITQLLLWTVFLVNLFFQVIKIPQFNEYEIFAICLLYGLPFFIISILVRNISILSKTENIEDEYKTLKFNPDVFQLILQKQTYYPINKSISKIKFGNTNSDIVITIISNPFCEACSENHNQVEELLRMKEDKICVLYIFVNFLESVKVGSRFLISSYLNRFEDSRTIFKSWYVDEKNSRKKLFKKWESPFDDQIITDEINMHEEWIQNNNIHTAPIVLVNGYKLPSNYSVLDLIFLL